MDNKYTYTNYDMLAFKQEVDAKVEEIITYLDNAARKCADLSNFENQLSIYKDQILAAKAKIANYKGQGYSSSSLSDPFNKLKSIESSYKKGETI